MVQNIIYEIPLSGNARHVYSALCYMSDSDGRCWPGKKHLAKLCDIGVTSVYKALKELERVGLVTITPQFFKGHQSSNLYVVYDYPGEAFEQQTPEITPSDNSNICCPHSHSEPLPPRDVNPYPCVPRTPTPSPCEPEQYSFELNSFNKREGATPPPPSPNAQRAHGEFKSVKLTPEGYDELIRLHGAVTVAEFITQLDYAIANRGYKSNDHYLTLREWIHRKLQREKEAAATPPSAPKPNRFINFTQRNTDFDALEKLEREYLEKKYGGGDPVT